MAACTHHVIAAGYEAPTVKLKRRKTTAAAQAATSIPAADPSNTAAQPAVPNTKGETVTKDLPRKATKRKRDQTAAASLAEAGKETEHATPAVPGNAPTSAGDVTELAGDAPGSTAVAGAAPQNALSKDGNAPPASQGTSAEVHTQSRQARRKQLRRTLNRE